SYFFFLMTRPPPRSTRFPYTTLFRSTFAMTWADKTVTNRRTAGTLLLSKVRLIERARETTKVALGSIGGFELVCSAGHGAMRTFAATLLLRRTDYDELIRLEHDLTPTGLIARIEHILEHIPLALREHERLAADAARRLAEYEQRLGQPFALQGELDAKRAELVAMD